MSSKERRLVAIMFTDLVGYTKLAQARESLALELLEEHRSIVRPLLTPHEGTEVKTTGDGFLVEFKSSLEAVLCAVEIQKQMARRNSKASVKALNRMTETQSWPFLIATLPVFAELRKDPRYPEFCAKVGLPMQAPT